MAQKRKGYYSHGIKRRTYETWVFLACVFGVFSIVLSILLFGGSTTDGTLEGVLTARVVFEEEAVRSNASQLSRTGGSTTMSLLGRTRQHLYALTQLNDLSATLLSQNKTLVPPEAINGAMAALEACISRLLEGQAIDAQLSTLWEELAVIQQAVAQLGG